jgi:hypothetical protein
MKNTRLLALLLLAAPTAALAQTKPTTTTTTTKPTTTTTAPTPGTQQQTEVTEDLDPATGKVIRRTTRTINVPVGTTAPATTGTTVSTADMASVAATDAQVSTFLRKKTVVSTLTAPALLSAYDLFMQRVRNDRQNWKPADWSAAAAVMSSLNSRYDVLRSSFSLDDKLTIRSQQGEFQALRTAKQISTQVSDKL